MPWPSLQELVVTPVIFSPVVLFATLRLSVLLNAKRRRWWQNQGSMVAT